jgi:hypothetical protein
MVMCYEGVAVIVPAVTPFGWEAPVESTFRRGFFTKSWTRCKPSSKSLPPRSNVGGGVAVGGGPPKVMAENGTILRRLSGAVKVVFFYVAPLLRHRC